MTEIARFKSPCGLCDVPILPGEPIEDVEGEWAHQDCAERDGYLLDDEGGTDE